jgi:cobaltochelatase CobT
MFIKDSGMNHVYRVFTTDEDKILHWGDTRSPFIKDIARYNYLMGGLDNTIATLKRKIELMIQATRKIDWDRRKEEGRFDSRRLVGAYNKEKDVFKVRDDASDLDTAVTLCIDMSGSMEGTRAKVAMQTCGLLAECLTKIGVPLEIIGFSTAHSDVRVRHDSLSLEEIIDQYTRHYDKLETYIFKKFSDRMFDAKQYLHHMSGSRGFGFHQNVDGESVEIAGKRLLKRPEKRKIMFVLSDGQPACSTRYDISLRNHLKRVVRDLGRKIDIVGIGLQSASVKQFYPNHVVLSSAEELPTTALHLLENAILQKNKEQHDANTEKFNAKHFKPEKEGEEEAA